MPYPERTGIVQIPHVGDRVRHFTGEVGTVIFPNIRVCEEKGRRQRQYAVATLSFYASLLVDADSDKTEVGPSRAGEKNCARFR